MITLVEYATQFARDGGGRGRFGHMVIRVKAPKKIRPTDDAWIVQAAGHERRRDCSFRGGNIRIFATVDV
jgi:hypothetical protein